MRVHVVDPSAYTPPYDHALCRALGLAGAEVELFTSRFAYGPVAIPEGYERRELFYRTARFAPGSRAQRLAKLAEHVPDMLAYRRAARAADVVHFQWLPVQHVDGHLLPGRRTASGARRPLVLTAHDVLPREPRPGQLAAQRRLYDRFDAIVVHSEHGRARLTHELGLGEDRVHVIPHGVFAHLADVPPQPPPFETEKPVVLCFGLMRPYKGIDVLLEAWRAIDDAELWIAGMPRMDISSLRASAPPNVRFVPRFITDSELPAYFQRADLVVLPYREIDQSGVLFTALAFGKPLAAERRRRVSRARCHRRCADRSGGRSGGAARGARGAAGRSRRVGGVASSAREAAEGKYSWGSIARRTLDLYRSLAA